jgi:Sulfotransferase domain
VPRPSFFIVGPPRTGTTWIYELLKGRANLPKYTPELRFFDTHYSKGMRWYSSQFEPLSPALPVGEICSTYFYSTEAQTRIAAFSPNAKIICTFREPVDRLFSLYRAKRAGGLLRPCNFVEAMCRDREMIESSRYAFHLANWQRKFGKKHVLVAMHDDLVRDPQGYLDRITAFVGIPSFSLTSEELQPVNSYRDFGAPWSFRITHLAAGFAEWLRLHRLGFLVVAVKRSMLRKFLLGGGECITPLDLGTVRWLREFLRQEIDEFEVMTGRDLSAWKACETEQQVSRAGSHMESAL